MLFRSNLEPALHAHVIPRSLDEPPELRTKPIWSYDWEAAVRYEEGFHGELRKKIRGML